MTSNIVRAKLQFFLFADETNALYAHKDLKTLELTVNAELHNLYNWLTSNKLSLNIKKSKYVIFRPYQKKLNYDPQSNEMLFRVLGSKFGMGYLKFLKKDRKKLLKDH